MDDRELLELAAKAAGYRVEPTDDLGSDYLIWRIDDWFTWRPLTDDGDALRLAVRLKLIITFTGVNGPYVSVGPRMGPFSNEPMPITPFGLQQDSDLTATRRAIVRAAADLAKDAEARG